MTILKRIIFLTPLIITLAACSSSASFIPYEDELPDAVVGTSYFQKVDIFGGRVIAGRKPILGTIEPDDNGIFMENCRLPDYAITPDTTLFVDANCVEIKGTPVRTGTVNVTLDGMFYGNMYTSGGNYEKTYLIKIVAGKE